MVVGSASLWHFIFSYVYGSKFEVDCTWSALCIESNWEIILLWHKTSHSDYNNILHKLYLLCMKYLNCIVITYLKENVCIL
jgi:hypothetical protein